MDKRRKEVFSLGKTHPRTGEKHCTHELYELSKQETGQLPLEMRVLHFVIERKGDCFVPHSEYIHT